ncbi:MAG: hypothetical protein V1908_00750 [Candidatus Peregrinibacteria bacterium]
MDGVSCQPTLIEANPGREAAVVSISSAPSFRAREKGQEELSSGETLHIFSNHLRGTIEVFRGVLQVVISDNSGITKQTLRPGDPLLELPYAGNEHIALTGGNSGASFVLRKMRQRFTLVE